MNPDRKISKTFTKNSKKFDIKLLIDTNFIHCKPIPDAKEIRIPQKIYNRATMTMFTTKFI